MSEKKGKKVSLNDKITLTYESKLIDEVRQLKTEMTDALDDVKSFTRDLHEKVKPNVKDAFKEKLTELINWKNQVDKIVEDLLELCNIQEYELA